MANKLDYVEITSHAKPENIALGMALFDLLKGQTVPDHVVRWLPAIEGVAFEWGYDKVQEQSTEPAPRQFWGRAMVEQCPESRPTKPISVRDHEYPKVGSGLGLK